MEDVILVLPFNQSVKHLRVLRDHVQQFFITCVGAEPAAVSPAVSVDWGKQPVILTELVSVRLRHAVLGKQTDRQRRFFALSKTFFRRNTDVFQGKMTRRTAKRPAVRVRWELEEQHLPSGTRRG